MKLFHKSWSGPGEPVVLLHGLFGNQANWAWQARELARDYSVHAFDLRNHGRSPWSDEHSYRAMAGDLLESMDALGLERAAFIGHSMGGKAAMQAAFLAPERVAALLVEDIAPVDYPGDSFAPLEAMLAVEPAALSSRAEADRALSRQIKEPAVREFLLTNLWRGEDGKYTWRCNLEVISRYFDSIKGRPDPDGEYAGRVLFIKGSRSDYLREEHAGAVMERFPRARFRVIANAGHWVHNEKPDAFLRAAREFLGDAL